MDVKGLREALEMTQQEFGDRYGIPKRTVANWEGGVRQPPPYTWTLLMSAISRDLELLDIADQVAEDLGIDRPSVKFAIDPKKDSTLARLLVSKRKNPDVIQVTKGDVPFYELVFAIVHEMRRLEQIKRHPEWVASSLEAQEEGLEAYNLHPAVVDANAFALLYMETLFGVQPLFKELSPKVVREIHRQADKLARELMKKGVLTKRPQDIK